jgi:hypothetical protein
VAEAPSFAIWAVKDPNSGNLDRVQVIKVWDGKQKEKVFDGVWSGQRKLRHGKLPPVGNTVDLKSGRYANSIGSVELKTVWKDSDFKSHRFAAYYVRVLEIPTARWSTLLAIEHGLPWRRTSRRQFSNAVGLRRVGTRLRKSDKPKVCRSAKPWRR